MKASCFVYFKRQELFIYYGFTEVRITIVTTHVSLSLQLQYTKSVKVKGPYMEIEEIRVGKQYTIIYRIRFSIVHRVDNLLSNNVTE